VGCDVQVKRRRGYFEVVFSLFEIVGSYGPVVKSRAFTYANLNAPRGDSLVEQLSAGGLIKVVNGEKVQYGNPVKLLSLTQKGREWLKTARKLTEEIEYVPV